MPARAARAPRVSRATVPAAPPASPAVAEPAIPAFAPESHAGGGEAEPAAPERAALESAIESASEPAPAAQQPSGYKGLKVWQRAMELAAAVHAAAAALPGAEQDALAADLRRSAVQVPAYIAAGNSLFQRADYVQYLSSAHGALARLETLLMLAERVSLVPSATVAPLLGRAGQVGMLLRALARALRPPATGGSLPGA